MFWKRCFIIRSALRCGYMLGTELNENTRLASGQPAVVLWYCGRDRLATFGHLVSFLPLHVPLAVCVTMGNRKCTAHIFIKCGQMWGAPTCLFPPSLTDVTAVICSAVVALHSTQSAPRLPCMAVGLPCKSIGGSPRLLDIFVDASASAWCSFGTEEWDGGSLGILKRVYRLCVSSRFPLLCTQLTIEIFRNIFSPGASAVAPPPPSCGVH